MNEIIARLAVLIQEHLADITEMGAGVEYAAFQQDKKLRKAIEWSIVSAVEICVNIGRHIISQKSYRIPDNSREVFEVLSENEAITEPVLKKMKMAVGYRNMAIHRYGDIDTNTTYIIMKKNYKDIEEFLKQVLESTDLSE